MEEVIDYVLRKNSDAITAGLGSLNAQDPLEAMIAAEEAGEDDEEWAIVVEAWHRIMEFFFAAGPEPLEVIRRLYGIVKALKPELLGHMSNEDIALLCDDAVRWDPEKGEKGGWVAGRATVGARIERVYGRTLKEAGMKACRAPFQKNDSARRKFSEAQKGNRNRTKNHKKRRRRRR